MEKLGEQFLHQKDSKLHTTKPIEKTQARLKSKGEKISQKPVDKIEAHLNRIEDIFNPDSLKHHKDFDRKERNINLLKKNLYDNVIIKQEDIPEEYYENQRRLAREQGRGDIEVTEEMKDQLNEIIISDQKSTLDNWTNYLTSTDSDSYPMWAKYWTFTNMLKLSSFDKEKHAFGKRGKGTVAPFPDLNREALAYVADAIIKNISKEDTPDIKNNPELQKLLQGANFGKLYAHAIEKITPTEGDELLNIEGEWIKYDKGSGHMPLVKSLQGHGTGWCTAGETTAKAHLQGGDFYVYYSYDKQGKPIIPRVAIRMQGSEIGEVRGIAHEQNLDPYINDVVNDKMKEFPDGEEYQKKVADMKHLTEIDMKHQGNEELTKDELRFLYEIDHKIKGFGYQDDPRVKEILEGRDIKDDVSCALDCSRDQLSTTEEEALKGNIKFHYGNLNLSSLQSAKGLKLPETINGNLNLYSLQSAEGLELPETINGSLDLYSLQSAEGLEFPKTINGDLYLYSLRSAEGLKLPETINGYLDLYSLRSAEGLEFPETINGSLNLYNLQSAEGLEFPKTIDGSLHLSSLQSAKGLKLPETINGNLNLSSLQSAEGLELPETINGYLYLSSLQSAEGLKLPETINGYLDLYSLRSAEKEKLRIKYPNIKFF